jgi:hypothetical protein
LIDQFFVGFFQYFWLQAELLSHQNIMMMADALGKVMKIIASKIGRMNHVIILSVKQRLFSI